MEKRQKLENKVQEFWKKHELDLRIDPTDGEMLEWYVDKCLDLLPQLYRELEEAKMLPENATYHGFLQVFEFEFNKQRHEAIFGDMI